MALYANRHNNQITIRFVAGMMILCCLCAARALLCVGSRQFASSNSIIDSIFSFNSFGVFLTVSLCALVKNSFAFCGLTILFIIFALYGAALLCLLILRHISVFARFTLRLMTIFLAFIHVKFRNGLDLLTRRATFGNNHGFFLTKKLCLGPVSGYIPVSGLFYYTSYKTKNKFIHKRLTGCIEAV